MEIVGIGALRTSARQRLRPGYAKDAALGRLAYHAALKRDAAPRIPGCEAHVHPFSGAKRPWQPRVSTISGVRCRQQRRGALLLGGGHPALAPRGLPARRQPHGQAAAALLGARPERLGSAISSHRRLVDWRQYCLGLGDVGLQPGRVDQGGEQRLRDAARRSEGALATSRRQPALERLGHRSRPYSCPFIYTPRT